MNARGFTLIEVMIALFVLAIMAGIAWQGVDMVVRSRDTARARTEAVLRLHSVISQWESDLRAMVTTQDVSDVAPGFEVQGNAMRLIRQSPEGYRVVVWSLRGNQWYRWNSPPQTRAESLQEAWLGSYQLMGNEAGTLRTLSGISGLQLYTFSSQSNAWSNALSTGDRTADDTSGKQRDALPDGIRLVLSFQGSTVGPGSASATGTLTRTLRLVHP